MILGESVLLALAAALAGSVVAAGGLFLLTRSPKVNGFIEPGLSPWVVVTGTAITVVIRRGRRVVPGVPRRPVVAYGGTSS